MKLVRARVVAYLAVVALGFASCGDQGGPQAGRVDRDVTTTSVPDGQVPVAALTAFSDAVAKAPRWAQARRFGAMPFEEQLAETTGAIQGTVVGLQAGPPVERTPEEALGFEDPVNADNRVVLQDAYLMVEISHTVGASTRPLSAGEVVAVPIPIWLSGSAGLSGDDFASEVVDSLEEAVPIGAPTVVLIQAVDRSSDVPLLDLAGDSDWNSLSAVAFEAADGTLFGLDVGIQTHANEHYGVSTLDEIAAKAA
jgi:hypothetical protein